MLNTKYNIKYNNLSLEDIFIEQSNDPTNYLSYNIKLNNFDNSLFKLNETLFNNTKYSELEKYEELMYTKIYLYFLTTETEAPDAKKEKTKNKLEQLVKKTEDGRSKIRSKGRSKRRSKGRSKRRSKGRSKRRSKGRSKRRSKGRRMVRSNGRK